MPIFGKGKANSGRFLFTLRIHELAPFPSRFSSTSIVWNRGSKKGSLRTVKGSSNPAFGSERLARFLWNEEVQVECSLSSVRFSPPWKTTNFVNLETCIAVEEFGCLGEIAISPFWLVCSRRILHQQGAVSPVKNSMSNPCLELLDRTPINFCIGFCESCAFLV